MQLAPGARRRVADRYLEPVRDKGVLATSSVSEGQCVGAKDMVA